MSPAAGAQFNGGARATATVRFNGVNAWGESYVPGSGGLELQRNGQPVLTLDVTEHWLSPSNQYEVTWFGYGDPKYPLTPAGTNTFTWVGDCYYYDKATKVLARDVSVKN